MKCELNTKGIMPSILWLIGGILLYISKIDIVLGILAFICITIGAWHNGKITGN
jgi:hypothetical protein